MSGWQVMELTEQLTQFQERLLDQTEEAQHANAQLETLRREHDKRNIEQTEQLQRVDSECSQLQVAACCKKFSARRLPRYLLDPSNFRCHDHSFLLVFGICFIFYFGFCCHY